MALSYEWEEGGKKKFFLLIVVIAALSVIAVYVLVISPSMIGEKKLELSECQDKITQWCDECYSINNERIDFWENVGTKIGKALAECSNDYFGTDWTQEQDCTGNAIGYCLSFLSIPIEGEY